MFTNILVPTDFSENAKNALHVATDLAESLEANVELLHVVDVSAIARLNEFTEYEQSAIEVTKKTIDKMLQAAQRSLNQMKQVVAHKNVTVSTSVMVGQEPKKVVNTILSNDFDLLVVGGKVQAKKTSFLETTMRGKIIRSAKCPVLIVNDQVERFQLSKIVLATQLKKDLSNVMPKIKALQSFFLADSHLLFVNTPQQFKETHEIRQLAQDFMEKHQLKGWIANNYNAKSVESGILKFAEDIQANLTIVCTENASWAYRFFQGDFVNGIAKHSPRPVLIFNTQNIKEPELIPA